MKSIGNDQWGVVANPIINIWLFSDLEYGLQVQSLRTNWQKMRDKKGSTVLLLETRSKVKDTLEPLDLA